MATRFDVKDTRGDKRYFTTTAQATNKFNRLSTRKRGGFRL